MLQKKKCRFTYRDRDYTDYVIDICGLEHTARIALAAHFCVSSMSIPPSFSSFPPSFSSFPDLGDSSRKDPETAASGTPAQRRDFKDKDKQSDRKKRNRDRRDKSSNLGQIPSGERRSGSLVSQDHGQVFHDDERIKAEEDSARRAGQQDNSQLVSFSDKKGDPLNAQYGGIYFRDVPKYHLAGCEYC